jgi:hypothetical protein
MQTVLYILAKSSRQSSLREVIVSELSEWTYEGKSWKVVSKQTKGRPRGWAKIRQEGCHGALNIEWDADAKTLICRAVSRQGNDSSELVGDFIAHLLRWHGRKISSITMRTI